MAVPGQPGGQLPVSVAAGVQGQHRAPFVRWQGVVHPVRGPVDRGGPLPGARRGVHQRGRERGGARVAEELGVCEELVEPSGPHSVGGRVPQQIVVGRAPGAGHGQQGVEQSGAVRAVVQPVGQPLVRQVVQRTTVVVRLLAYVEGGRVQHGSQLVERGDAPVLRERSDGTAQHSLGHSGPLGMRQSHQHGAFPHGPSLAAQSPRQHLAQVVGHGGEGLVRGYG